MTSRFGFKLGAALLLSLFALAPASAVMAQDVLSETVKRLEKKFASAQETLEYHLMLRVPNTGTKEPEKIIDALKESLGPIVKLDAPSGPKTVAYLDSPSRTLGKSNLVVRIRPGQLTIKVRSTSLHNLIDLKETVAPPQLYRYNRFNSATVSSGLAPGVTIGQGLEEMDRIAKETLDDTFRTALAGDSKSFQESSDSLFFAFGLAIVLYTISCYVRFDSEALRLAFNTVLFGIFFFVLIKRDLPLSEIPVIGKVLKKK